MRIIKFKSLHYKVGDKGRVFRLRNHGSSDVPDDWLKSTLTEKELDHEMKVVADKEARDRKRQDNQNQYRKKTRIANE
jgi:hypothetical protein